MAASPQHWDHAASLLTRCGKTLAMLGESLGGRASWWLWALTLPLFDLISFFPSGNAF